MANNLKGLQMTRSVNKLEELKENLENTKKAIVKLGKLPTPSIEVINPTNLLRENEYLKKNNEFKMQLLEQYDNYVSELELNVSLIIKTQSELKSLLNKSTKSKKTIHKKTTKSKTKHKSKIKKKRK